MRTLRTRDELRAALAEHRRAGATIALVPTMGAFHAGHLALIERARQLADIVVVSLFVNPAQFAPGEDLERYPRDEAADAAAAQQAGVELLFAPTVEEIYPRGFSTIVRVGGLREPLEGRSRGAEHFDGVATVVTKLLNIVAPDVAVFGQKDAQQAAVIKRLVRDLDISTRIEIVATVRDPDGLALSSRNAYLSQPERERALALRRALEGAEQAIAGGERDPRAVIERARAELDRDGIEPEYLELVSADELQPIERVDGDVLVAVAARVGAARLIDNALIHVDGKVN